MKLLATFGACGLLNLLYASFAMTATATLARIDPLVFTTLQMLMLTPLALFLVWQRRTALNRSVLLWSLALGSSLGAGFLLIALALHSVGITESTVLSCVNGVLAALVGWRILHQRLTWPTWAACACAMVGAVLMGIGLPLRWQGDFTAFLGGSLFTLSTFIWESFVARHPRQAAMLFWPVMAWQFVVMTSIVLILALCFGAWSSLANWQPVDGLVLLYTSIAAVLATTLLSSWIQLTGRASAITIAFFAILDPLTSAAFAFFIIGERLPLLSYLGGICVLGSMLLQALATLLPPPASLPAPAPTVVVHAYETRQVESSAV